jgi:hypothetical protein
MKVTTVGNSRISKLHIYSRFPIYTCVLSLGPLHRMQLSNAYMLCHVYSVTVKMWKLLTFEFNESSH